MINGLNIQIVKSLFRKDRNKQHVKEVTKLDNINKVYFQIVIPKGIINCKVNVFLSLFIKFSAKSLHQDIRNDICS